MHQGHLSNVGIECITQSEIGTLIPCTRYVLRYVLPCGIVSGIECNYSSFWCYLVVNFFFKLQMKLEIYESFPS